MKTCPYCHSDLPDDSVFCDECGKRLTFTENERKEDIDSNQIILKKNSRINHLSQISLIIFLFSMIVMDFILATILQNLNVNPKIIFYISGIFYILAIVLGITSIIIDYKDLKKGFEQTGSYGVATVSIVLSFYLILVNITHVIIK